MCILNLAHFSIIQGYGTLNVILAFRTRALFLLISKSQFVFKLMNWYQACLYLFECIFHGDSKYSNESQYIWIFWTFCVIFDLSSAAWKAFNYTLFSCCDHSTAYENNSEDCWFVLDVVFRWLSVICSSWHVKMLLLCLMASLSEHEWYDITIIFIILVKYILQYVCKIIKRPHCRKIL